MNLMLFGAPGAGKGTQAKFLIEKYNIPQISTGDILRAAIVDKTDMGMEAKKFMDAGQLVPDSTIIGIIKDRLAESDCKDGFILDGFPRTLAQAEALNELMKNMGISLDKVISLNVPDELIVGRITGRRVCSKCGASFHVEFNPSKKENECDYCGSELIRRTIGLAHVADLDSIADDEMRRACQRHALNLGRTLILAASHIDSIDDLIARIRQNG